MITSEAIIDHRAEAILDIPTEDGAAHREIPELAEKAHESEPR